MVDQDVLSVTLTPNLTPNTIYFGFTMVNMDGQKKLLTTAHQVYFSMEKHPRAKK